MNTKPPPIIDSTRVLFFAINDNDVEYTDRIDLHIGNSNNEFVRLGEVPNLAITENYNKPNDYLLMFCDENWETKGVISFTTIEEAKIKAERGYKGITKKWQSSPYTQNEVDDYLRDEYEVDPKSEWWTIICSFCGKKDSELGAVIKGKYASICKRCISEYYRLFNENA